MAPGPVPNPVVAFTAGAFKLNPYVEHYLDDLLVWMGLADPTAVEWRRLTAQWRYNSATDPKDDAYCTFDFTNITGGALDTSWTTSDYTTCEGKLDTLFGALAAQQNAQVKLINYRWYKMAFNPYSTSIPFRPSGPPQRVTARSIAGTSAGIPLAPQSAISVTEKTVYPRNWGRFYIPFLGATVMQSSLPLILNSVVDAVATAYQTFVNSMAASDFQVVVPMTSLGTGGRGDPGAGAPTRQLTQIDHVQVDSVLDVIRRRRTNAVPYRKVLP